MRLKSTFLYLELEDAEGKRPVLKTKGVSGHSVLKVFGEGL